MSREDIQKAIRVAVFERVESYIAEHPDIDPEDLCAAMLQVASIGVVKLDGDVAKNLNWALKNFLSVFKQHCDIDFEVELQDDSEQPRT